MSERLPLIDRYLAELRQAGMDDGRLAREARAHLVEATRQGRAAGLDLREAQEAAIARFGPAPELARLHWQSRADARTARAAWRARGAVVVLSLVLGGGGVAIAASLALQKPVFGLLVREDHARKRSASGGLLYAPPSATLVRVDPRTLRALPGRRILLGRGWFPAAYSADGSRLALVADRKPLLRVVDLDSPLRGGQVRLGGGADTSVRELAWVSDDRLLAIVQRLGPPYGRRIASRSLLVVDPLRRTVLARRSLPRQALFGSAHGGDLAVFMLGDSSRRRAYVELLVAKTDGSLRRVRVIVGRSFPSGARVPTQLTVEPSGRRAFVTTWAGRVFEVDLASLRVVAHSPSYSATTLRRSGYSLPQVAWVGDRYLALGGGGRHSTPLSGVWLLDTQRWLARPLGRHAGTFIPLDDKLLVYGPTTPPPSKPLRFQGIDGGQGLQVDAYALDGRHLYRLHPGRRIGRLVVVGGYLHTIALQALLGRMHLQFPSSKPLPARAVYDVDTGRNLGRISRPAGNLFVLDRQSVLLHG